MSVYLYLDNKIHGACDQVISYFKSGVLNERVTVLFKYYKKSNKYYSKSFKENGIKSLCFRKISDLKLSESGVVLYMFNAQSNCSFVANRSFVHIFITHGESNKLASVKPIIRIYDHVIVAGDLGVDRLLANGLFNSEDIKSHRIIKMGDTFIGYSRYYYDPKGALLYAPTWEGGNTSEDYSSLKMSSVPDLLYDYMLKNGITSVCIQPHPNTGHRDERYKVYLSSVLNYFLSKNVKVYFRGKPSWFKRLFLKWRGVELLNSLPVLPISSGVTDISAMEIQLINQKIPTTCLILNSHRSILENELLREYLINYSTSPDKTLRIKKIERKYFDYFIGYSFSCLETIAKEQRLNWLVDFVCKKKLAKELDGSRVMVIDK